MRADAARHLLGDPWFEAGWDLPARVAQGIRR
jgi:hypothetical protein